MYVEKKWPPPSQSDIQPSPSNAASSTAAAAQPTAMAGPPTPPTLDLSNILGHSRLSHHRWPQSLFSPDVQQDLQLILAAQVPSSTSSA
eukprot:6450871-Pyramimonas_sp.AAC.1